MFVKDFKREFYDVLQNQRLLVLVAFDVDALCASRILQYLLQCDHVMYTIVPVYGRRDIESAFVENCEGIKNVLLVNCGATMDIVELLQPLSDVTFYICDSHRPVDVCNVYNAIQVKLLLKEGETTDVPEYDNVFRDDESPHESGNESDDSSGAPGRLDMDAVDRKRDRRLWNERRAKIIFDYTQFSYFSTASSLLMFELAWKMSKDTNDLLWLAIVGVTDQYLHYKTTREKYFEDVMALQSHVSRHNHRTEEGRESHVSVDCLHLSFDEELQLSLYRHWSLIESLTYSINTACRFKLWTLKGTKRMQEFLAEIGLPYAQCKQRFATMDSSVKANIKSMIMAHMTKYGLSSQDLIVPSFCAQYGYKKKLCASDVVLACAATLESIESSKTNTDCFLAASDVLQRHNTENIDKALDVAKCQLRATIGQVQSFLDIHQIISAGPYLYTLIQEGTHSVQYFSRPQCLSRLARFTLEAYCSMSRNKRALSLPLVLAAPLNLELGTLIVIGIPPLELDEERRNFFGKAFEQAASSTNSRSLQDFFDPNVIELKMEDKSRFFDGLIRLLQ